MANPTSNAVAIVTLQDQDLVNPGLTNLVQRLAASVIYPTITLVYSGYTNTIPGTPITLFAANTNSPFVYVRNVICASGNALSLTITPQGAAAYTLNLTPGGVWLYANQISSGTPNPSNQISTITASGFAAGSIITFEYLYAI